MRVTKLTIESRTRKNSGHGAWCRRPAIMLPNGTVYQLSSSNIGRDDYVFNYVDDIWLTKVSKIDFKWSFKVEDVKIIRSHGEVVLDQEKAAKAWNKAM